MSAMQQIYMTADKLYAMPEDGFKYELVRRDLVKMPLAGFEHGEINMKVRSHVTKTRLGRVAIAENGYQPAEDHELAPDMSYVSASYSAVEMISPGERECQIMQKVTDNLRYGCKMVVVVRPRTLRVEGHLSSREPQILEPGDVLDGGIAVPGCEVPVADILE